MEKLLRKYSDKIVKSGLSEKDSFFMAGLDDEIITLGSIGKSSPDTFFSKLSINSLLYAVPKEPYRSIINYLAKNSLDKIEPEDCETRTFLHDLPVISENDPAQAASILKERKCVIVKGKGVYTTGNVSPEQCYVNFSSVLFSTFVKFFSDYLRKKKNNNIDSEAEKVFRNSIPFIKDYHKFDYDLSKNIFRDENAVYSAIAEAGKHTVEYGLVDSFFGNVSAFKDGTLYISQTGSSLDELNGFIDACPIDGSTCTGLTASSELSAHQKIVTETDIRTIIHGHPLFSVILSMDCHKRNCRNLGKCHKNCSEKRNINGIPIVPGEVGTGPFGLCNTVPPALKINDGVIVYGHGVFTTGTDDFNSPFAKILEIERMCKKEYMRLTL